MFLKIDLVQRAFYKNKRDEGIFRVVLSWERWRRGTRGIEQHANVKWKPRGGEGGPMLVEIGFDNSPVYLTLIRGINGQQKKLCLFVLAPRPMLLGPRPRPNRHHDYLHLEALVLLGFFSCLDNHLLPLLYSRVCTLCLKANQHTLNDFGWWLTLHRLVLSHVGCLYHHWQGLWLSLGGTYWWSSAGLLTSH